MSDKILNIFIVLLIAGAAVLFVFMAMALMMPGSYSELPASPLQLTLSIWGAPIVNSAFSVTTTLRKLGDSPFRNGTFNGTILYLKLPDGVEVVSGEVNWTGDLDKEKIIAITSVLKITRDGGYTIEAFAQSPTVWNSWVGDHKSVYIESYATRYNILPWHPIPTRNTARTTGNWTLVNGSY